MEAIKKLLLYFLLILSIAPLSAQQDSIQYPWVIGARIHGGFIIPHAPDLKSLAQNDPSGIQFEISKLKMSQRSWDYCRCFPKIGAAFNYYNYSEPDSLGNSYNLSFFIEPEFGAHKKIFFSLRPQLGVTYLNKPFDSINNPNNTFYSSTISFLVSLSAAVNVNIAPRWRLNFAANYNHISNGGIKEPNRGMNFPTLSIGVEYLTEAVKFPDYSINRESYQKRKFLDLGILLSAQTANDQPGRHPLYGLFGSYNFSINRKSIIKISTEWVNDGALKENLEQEGLDMDHNRIAILLGHDMLIGRFRFGFDLGAYVYSPVKARDPVYQRYSLRYTVNNKFYIGTTIKSHRQVADYLDLRFGRFISL
ncbi:MAG TPA: acyloxyacyl hydrolase [Cyclobacteriaceae bacterium]